MPPIGADPGFSGGETYAIGLLFLGLALFAAVGALSHQRERAFSAALIYLGLGVAAAAIIGLGGIRWVDPVDDALLIERVTEIAVIVALFGTGLKLDRALSWGAWSSVVRLLALAMPLTIGAVAVFGMTAMGLSLGAAIVLGAALAPTDPVLAGDVGVGPPGEEEAESEPNFSLTAEAGLNDGLAFPFVLLGLFVAGEGGSSWLGEWLAADVAYGVLLAVLIGGLAGHGIAGLFVNLRERDLLLHELDGWLAVATVLAVYGLTETVGAYGFVAAFASGVAFRRYEQAHEYNQTVHRGAETVENFAELAVILLLGSMLTLEGLSEPGIGGWLLVPVLLLLVRPLSVAVACFRSRMDLRGRAFVGWFGVRGIGTLYYVAVGVGAGVVSAEEQVVVTWTAIACVLISIGVHGVTAAPLGRRLT